MTEGTNYESPITSHQSPVPVLAIDGPGGSAQERLARIAPALRQWFGRNDFYGCPFINAVAEHDKTSDRLRQLALRHKLQVLAFIRDVAVEAGVAEPDRLTHEIALLIDGAIVAAMITKDPGVADVAQKALTTLLDDQLRGVAPALS